MSIKLGTGQGVYPSKTLHKNGAYELIINLDFYFLDNCYLQPTDEDEILKINSKLGGGKSPGHDNIKSSLIKPYCK